jgi:small subunit ribosomal protein S3
VGQKAHPKSLRLGIIYRSWDNNWIAGKRQYAEHVLEDHVIRAFIKKRYKFASLSKVEIERKAQKLIIRMITGRPGVLVGRGGQGLDSLRKDLSKLTKRKDIQLDVLEVAKIDADAQLIAESIAQQQEKRIPYRRAIKQSIQRAMRSGAKGIKIMVAGRLGGVEIARTEWSREGRIPLHTFRADIDYGFAEALTVFGIIGVKVWVFRGEVLPGDSPEPNIKLRNAADSGAGGPQGDRPRRPGGPGGAGNRGRRSPNATTRMAGDAKTSVES